MTGTARADYRRVVLKLSGEALAAGGGMGLDPKVLHLVAREIKSVRDDGVDVAIVIGGGNIVRGVQIAEHMGLTRTTADYIGLPTTVINALARQDAMGREALETRGPTAGEMHHVANTHTT